MTTRDTGTTSNNKKIDKRNRGGGNKIFEIAKYWDRLETEHKQPKFGLGNWREAICKTETQRTR